MDEKYHRLAKPIELYYILYAYIISVHENCLIEAQTTGVIHTDFEKGFIRAEVTKYDDLKRLGTEQAIKDAGLYKVDAKEYVVHDEDIMYFRFNV